MELLNGSEQFQDFEAVSFRKIQIEQYKVRRRSMRIILRFPNKLKRLFSVRDHMNFERQVLQTYGLAHQNSVGKIVFSQ